MARKTKQAPLRTRSGVVLDDKKIQELVRVFEDDETEWGEPASEGAMARSWPRPAIADG